MTVIDNPQQEKVTMSEKHDELFSQFNDPNHIVAIQKQIKDYYFGYEAILNSAVDLLLHAKRCESPIESLLFWELHLRWTLMPAFGCGLFASGSKIERVIVDLECQKTLTVTQSPSQQGAEFRIDFFLSITNNDTGDMHYVCVEVDGHNFHEKTKEQAQRDKLKDRLLQRVGYQVLRYTGSEVYKNSGKVVGDIESHIRSLVG